MAIFSGPIVYAVNNIIPLGYIVVVEAFNVRHFLELSCLS